MISRNQEARPVGRPSLGITKKVSLTMTEDQWTEIEASGLTVAAFLKECMKSIPKAETEPTAVATVDGEQPVSYQRRYAEERWDIYLRNIEEQPQVGIIEAAKESMFRIMYPDGLENAVVRTIEQYECPFTGKRFGSMDKLVRAAIPHLINRATNNNKHKSELDTIRKREKEPKYFCELKLPKHCRNI